MPRARNRYISIHETTRVDYYFYFYVISKCYHTKKYGGVLGNPYYLQVFHTNKDGVRHFRQRWWLCHLKMWYQVRQGRLLQEICDYILGTDWRRFEMVVIRDVCNYYSENFYLRYKLLQHPIVKDFRSGRS